MEPTPKWNNMVVGWSIQKNKGTNIWIWRNSSRSRQPTNVTIWSQVQELANTFPEALQRRHPDKGILNGVGEHHWVCYCCMHQLSKSQFKAQVAHGGIWCSQGAFDDRVDTLSASWKTTRTLSLVRPKGQMAKGTWYISATAPKN